MAFISTMRVHYYAPFCPLIISHMSPNKKMSNFPSRLLPRRTERTIKVKSGGNYSDETPGRYALRPMGRLATNLMIHNIGTYSYKNTSPKGI